MGPLNIEFGLIYAWANGSRSGCCNFGMSYLLVFIQLILLKACGLSTHHRHGGCSCADAVMQHDFMAAASIRSKCCDLDDWIMGCVTVTVMSSLSTTATTSSSSRSSGIAGEVLTLLTEFFLTIILMFTMWGILSVTVILSIKSWSNRAYSVADHNNPHAEGNQFYPFRGCNRLAAVLGVFQSRLGVDVQQTNLGIRKYFSVSCYDLLCQGTV